jgi:hypothetical protein
MATRTVSRDRNNVRAILVWPKGVAIGDVKVNNDDAHYAYLNGKIVQPVAFSADQFKAAFGFVPCSGTIQTYEMGKPAPKCTAVERAYLDAAKALARESL